jgi:hypothetical protein
MTYGEKACLVGHFLKSLKKVTTEDVQLSNLGVNISSLGAVEDCLWDCIKLVVGMPEHEELGVWISDYWLDLAFEYINETLPKDEAVIRIIDWQNEFDD